MKKEEIQELDDLDLFLLFIELNREYGHISKEGQKISYAVIQVLYDVQTELLTRIQSDYWKVGTDDFDTVTLEKV